LENNVTVEKLVFAGEWVQVGGPSLTKKDKKKRTEAAAAAAAATASAKSKDKKPFFLS
jgi:ribosomal protein S11